MTSSTTTDERSNSIDRNRNITTLESNANFNNAVKQLTTFNNNLNNRINNLVPNGILKKPPRVPNSTPVHRPSPKSLEPDEVRDIIVFIILDIFKYLLKLVFFIQNS